jgi:hypothetical protein
VNAFEVQLFWTQVMLIFLGIGILKHGLARTLCVAAAIGGSTSIVVMLIFLAVTR